MEGGPFTNAKTKIKKGVIIEKINGETITDEIDWSRMMNRQVGKKYFIKSVRPRNQTTLG